MSSKNMNRHWLESLTEDRDRRCKCDVRCKFVHRKLERPVYRLQSDGRSLYIIGESRSERMYICRVTGEGRTNRIVVTASNDLSP